MPSWFDQEVDELERRTASRRGEPNLLLFYGSSSFTLWHDIADHFPEYNLVNHGFGGSTLVDCLEYFDRLVAAFRPALIILYAGDNDLGNGGTPEGVLAALEQFLTRKRATLGAVPMAYVSIKISPARFPIMHRITYTNLILERRLAGEADAAFVNITRRMTGRGLVDFLQYYTEDPLHMNEAGYRVLGRSLAEYLAAAEAAGGPLKVRPAAAAPAWAAETPAAAGPIHE
jgi:lysophospholipase L1-like esterase